MKFSMKSDKFDVCNMLGIFISLGIFLFGFCVNIRFFFMFGFSLFLVTCIILVSRKSVFGVAFIVSLFTFLCGRFIVNWIAGKESLISGAYITDTGPTDLQLFKTFLAIVISIIFFIIGIRLPVSSDSVRLNRENETKGVLRNQRLRQSVVAVFYTSLVFEIVVSCERAAFLLFSGALYTDYYVYFSRTLPPFVYKIAELNTPAFFSILALKMSKRETKIMMFLYSFDKLIILFSGQRNQFVRAILMCSCYMILRNKIDGGDWLKKREKRLMTACIPIGIIALQAWGIIRDGLEFSFSGLLGEISDFFIDQGSTSVVIYKGFEYRNVFPKDVLYIFSPIVNFFRDNVITRFLFSFPVYAQHTAEYAVFGNNYGATLAYLYLPHLYLSGIGMGTSYLAESFHDFGWIGIALISLLYGLLLVVAERYLISNDKHVFKSAVLLMFVDGILYAPRSETLGFLTYGVNFTTVCFFALIFVLSSFSKTTMFGEDLD